MRRLALLLVFTLIGCQQTPTKTTTTQTREFELVHAKTGKPLEIAGGLTAVLDTRPAFEYGLNRIENSIHFPWSNLAEKEDTAELLRDPRKAARRLALVGLNPATPVVVVGHGRQGAGEEGRLAWNLLYLGFRDVQVANVTYFRKNWTQNNSAPPENVPEWDASPRAELSVGTDEFRRLAADPRGRLDKRIWLIDVRSPREYMAKDTPNVGALNVEWKEFYKEDGRPDPAIRAKLEAVGVKASDQVVLVSQRGVRSAAAAYALTALGFPHARNLLGGWRGLVK